MDAESVLEQARSDHPPSEWNIWPLRRNFVLTSAFKWGLLGIVGFALFIPVVMLTIPSDFTGKSGLAQSFAAVMLMLLAAMAFGGVGIALHDLWRWARASDYWLIVTPEAFVKAQPGRVILTPLENVSGLTLKGVPLPDEGNSPNDAPVSQFLISGRLIDFANTAGVPGVSRKRARGNASLAYRDSRDNKIVTICTDDAFDQMGAIFHVLRERVAIREDQIWRASLESPQA